MSNWFEQAKSKKEKLGESYTYSMIASEFNVHYDTVRKKFRDDRIKQSKLATGGIVDSKMNVTVNLDNKGYVIPQKITETIKEALSIPSIVPMIRTAVKEEVPLQEKVMDIISKGAKIVDICTACNIKPTVLAVVLADIKDQGYNLFEAGDYIKLSKVAIPSTATHELHWDGSQIIRYGIVSDTHLCSKFQQLTHLNSIYDTFAREGISTVLHIGDIVEGINMRKGHEYELFVLGFDGQADYAIEKYPYRDGITTKFITGNHDHTGIKSAGADIGRQIAKERSDMEYLGLSNSRIKVTPNCTLEMNHGLDGSSYALSYTLQKCIDAFDSNDLPDIFLNGHHHKLMYTYYRNIHALECGTFQAQTSWMRGKRLAAHVGGLILTLHVDSNGKVTRFVPEFIPFYKTIEKDW